MKECKYCGTKYEDLLKTCPNCGGASIITDADRIAEVEQQEHEKAAYTSGNKKLRNFIFVGAGIVLTIILIIILSVSSANNKEYVYSNTVGAQITISKKEIKTAIELGTEYLDDGEYLSAIKEFNKVPSEYENYSEVEALITAAENGYADILLTQIDTMLGNEDFNGAVALFDSAPTFFSTNTKLAAKKNEVLGKYKEEFLTRASQYLSEGKYTEALSVLTVAKTIFSGDSDISMKTVEVNKAKVMEKITEYEQTLDYAGAITYIRSELANVNNDVEVQEKLVYFKSIYKDDLLTNAKTLLDSDGYEAAVAALNDGLTVLGADSDISAMIETYEGYAPVYLFDMDYFTNKGDFEEYAGIKDNLNYDHDRATAIYFSDNRTILLEDKFKRLEGSVFICYDNRSIMSYKLRVFIYGDGKILFDSGDMAGGVKPISFNIDLSTIQELVITAKDDGKVHKEVYPIFIDAELYKY